VEDQQGGWSERSLRALRWRCSVMQRLWVRCSCWMSVSHTSAGPGLTLNQSTWLFELIFCITFV
jgi:hypothetical protein